MLFQRRQNAYEGALLWLVALGVFMETLDSTIVNTALPAMAVSLSESPLRMQSVVIAYSLTLALLIPASGWVVDRFGTRRTYFSALSLFTFGSVCCAASQTLNQLVASRVLQGIGGSMLMPVGRLAVLRAFPGKKYLNAISFVAVAGMVGPLVGPTLGGWLVEASSWHWIFLINLPIGLLGGFTTAVAMPVGDAIQPKRFDGIGFALLSLSMVSLSLGLEGLSELGLSVPIVTLFTTFGFICLVAYGLRAAGKPDVLFPLSLFSIETYRIGLLGNLFARVGSSSMPFLIPLLLQVGHGASPFEAGVQMIPVAIASILAKRLATPVITRYGYRRVLLVNTLLVGLSISSFALASRNDPLAIRSLQLFFLGAVNSLQFTAMNTLTLKDLDAKHMSAGNSLFSMIQMLAMGFAVALAAALLSLFTLREAGHARDTIAAFQWTFLCIGVITCMSAWIFWQLRAEETLKPGEGGYGTTA